MTETTKQMVEKPGHQTTEFWMTLFSTIIAASYAVGVVKDDVWWGKLIAVAAIVFNTYGYNASRTRLKQSIASNPDSGAGV